MSPSTPSLPKRMHNFWCTEVNRQSGLSAKDITICFDNFALINSLIRDIRGVDTYDNGTIKPITPFLLSILVALFKTLQ